MSGKGSKAIKKGRTPLAFMSYAHFDDKHDQGQLTKFRERLSGEVQVQTGEAFPIFQDRNDIKWGQQWQERIDNYLDEVTFLIPIITPSFFKSQNCREELEKFLQREEELGRNDLILPVYYVGCPILDDETKLKSDELAQVIAARQYADWRDLRFEPFTIPQVGKTLERLAIQIREALEFRQPLQKEVTAEMSPKIEPPLSVETASQAPEPDRLRGETAGFRPGPSAKTEPPTHIVHPLHRGDFASITEAIEAANPGDRILVYPGLYEEGLVLDKPLEIVGVGGPDEVIVQTKGKNVLLFKTTMGRVANLSLRQLGGDNWFGVDISQGRLELEDCDITCQSLACVAIHAGADPRLRRNRIHGGKTGGVFIYENGQGTFEDNDIFGNALSGVEIKEGGNPTIRRNRIHDGKASGVFVNDNGQGTLEDNDIFGNALAGVEIKEGGNPTLRRNRIHDGKQNGVFIYENGQGTLEDNDIFRNAYAGVNITEGGNPTLRRNRINKNGYEAVWISKGGGGTIEDNDLRDNARGPWKVEADSEPKVKRALNLE